MVVEVNLEWQKHPETGTPQLKGVGGDGTIYVVDRRATFAQPGLFRCDLGRLIGVTRQGKSIITVFPQEAVKNEPLPAEEAARKIADGIGASLQLKRAAAG